MEIIRQIWVVVIAIAAVVVIIVVATAVGAGGGGCRRHRRGHHGVGLLLVLATIRRRPPLSSLCPFCFGGKMNRLSITFSEKVQNSSVRQQSPASRLLGWTVDERQTNALECKKY